jgi:hypothetical protein
VNTFGVDDTQILRRDRAVVLFAREPDAYLSRFSSRKINRVSMSFATRRDVLARIASSRI